MEKYRFNDIELAHIERSPIPFAVYQFIDKRVVTLAVSQGLCNILGTTHEEAYFLLDNDMYRLAHPADVSRIADAAFRFATEGGTFDVVYRSMHDDEYLIVHALGEHITPEEGVQLAVVWYTIEGRYAPLDNTSDSELNQAMRKAILDDTLHQQTYYDQLTGLPNMTYFFELADVARQRMLEEGKQPVVLFFNLTDMKYFNQTHGFAEGDALINAVGKVLAGHFASENCSRFGKDHFAVITDADNLEDRLEAVFDDCKAINDGDNLPIRAGIYLDNMEPVSMHAACDRAKYACDLHREAYESKYRYFDDTMLAATESRKYIMANIDKALENGWVKVYYQPIVRSANGKVCDEEALARWFDPEKGMLSPAEFIPALEDAKLIYKLDLYVLDRVLDKMKAQAQEGLYVVPQSLNLSRADFDSVDIVEEIRQRMDDEGIPREKLTIEITESIVGSDFEFMKEQIARFQALGFKVWMDDFGSGYSSLDVLQSVPFDLIKLDMRFMERFGEGDESKIILTELVKMAIGLGIDTVTEGVETKEQADFLREIGCSRLQGFYYSKPIPYEEIFERNRLGLQIGFENPDEAEYFATIGKVNLYDPAIIAQDALGDHKKYFDTIPMAIYEVEGDTFNIARTNGSYRDFLQESFGISLADVAAQGLSFNYSGTGDQFLETLRSVSETGSPVVLDEELESGETTHSIIRRLAVNPVTGTAALLVAVMAIIDDEDHRAAITYASIAKALSSDYSYLYYVDLKTEDFIEYSSNVGEDGLSAERHDTDFFSQSRSTARIILHEDDQERFIDAFTKENLLHEIEQRGAFISRYRQIIDGKPTHMLMKAVLMDDGAHLIIGVVQRGKSQ